MTTTQHPTDKPLVSFIIAAYNEELYIKECIESCLAQTYPNIEVCVTDDGSTDATLQILEKYRSNTKVKIGRFLKNRGKVAAFNNSFDMASGEFIAIMGADDIAYTDRLEISMGKLGEYPLVFGDLTAFSDEAVISDSVMIDHFSMTKDQDVDFNQLLLQPCVFGGTITASKQILDAVFPIDEMMTHEDWWIPLVCASQSPIRYIAKPLISYRQHSGNATGTLSSNRLPPYRKWQNLETRHTLFYQKVSESFELCDEQRRHCQKQVAWAQLLSKQHFWGRALDWWTIAKHGQAVKACAASLCIVHPRLYHLALAAYTRLKRQAHQLAHLHVVADSTLTRHRR
jgi:hypothetical protein